MTKPKVSIVTITYNQEAYIAQALESFVMQKTNFSFEVIIADDCSNDKTVSIIKEYAEKYPDIIKPVLRKKNIGAIPNIMDAFKKTTGSYIALCEGDDYWTDNNKLQLQVDFLDKNSNYALCFHSVRVFFENNEEKESIFPIESDTSKFTTKELINGNFIQTNSVMYRRQDYKNLPTDVMPGDWYLHLYHAKFGKIGFINKTMSAYRRHASGIWWDSYNDFDEIWKKHGVAYFTLFVEIKKLYGDNSEYREIILAEMVAMINAFMEIDVKYNTEILKKTALKFPYTISECIKYQHDVINRKDHEMHKNNENIASLKSIIELKEHELNIIKSTKTWKARSVVAKSAKKVGIHKKRKNTL